MATTCIWRADFAGKSRVALLRWTGRNRVSAFDTDTCGIVWQWHGLLKFHHGDSALLPVTKGYLISLNISSFHFP